MHSRGGESFRGSKTTGNFTTYDAAVGSSTLVKPNEVLMGSRTCPKPRVFHGVPEACAGGWWSNLGCGAR